MQGKIERLETRIATLESSNKTHALPSSSIGLSIRTSLQNVPEQQLKRFFKGRGFKSHFQGPTNPLTLMVEVRQKPD